MNRRVMDGGAALADYRCVGRPDDLERAGLFVAEGRLIVERLLEDGRFRIRSVAVTPTAAAAMASVFERRPDVTVHVCEPESLQAITGFEFHRGCLALAWRDTPAVTVDALAQATRLLALQGVGNPDNVGGLFRTALALGTGGVLLDRATGDPLYRKAIRTSMGATLRLPFTRVPAWRSALDDLRRRGFRVIALTPASGAVPLDEVRPEHGERFILIVGAEGSGLTDDVLRYADMKVRIPVELRVDSLNVVVAAGIALHALRG